MEVVFESLSYALRLLLSGGGAPAAGSTYCLDKNVTYAHRVDNPEGWNWCLVPDGGYDAVFFAGLAIAVMCLASPRWDALIVLFFGGIYFTFSYYWNLEHVSNAVMLWLGMRPADIFVYVFLPPFLLDLAVRIDFFMLKKVAFNIAFMAFVMVAASALILIPFMLYALDLKSSGWTAAYVALFGSMIASTDAASVSAVLRSGGGPEILSVLLEGESLFNDASSLTLFEIFKEVVLEDAKTTLAHDLQGIVVMTIWSAFTGICIGLAMGILTRWIYAWLQHRNMEAMAEVAWSVAGAYLSFYITQVWCKGSGCIGAVAFGLYGSSTLLWGMSTKARLSGIFNQFWAVMIFIINGLIFFYVGASSVNFTIRSAQTLYDDSRARLVQILFYKLPLVYLASFSLRFILIFLSFKLLQLMRLSEGLSIQEVIFVTVGGLRGSLSLVLAQSAATLASTHEEDRKVKAEIAIYTAGYVIMTLLINAPLCGPLLTILGLDKVRQEQLAMRGEVKNLFRKFTSTAIEDLAAGQDEDELLQGLDWGMLKLHTDFDKQLDKELPEVQPRVRWCYCPGWVRAFAAPARLWRYLVACCKGRCAPGAVELDQGEEALRRQRQEADLKRATNINLRELNRNESRAPGSPSVPLFSNAPARLPPALIIRDLTGNSSGLAASPGRALTSATSYSAANTASGRRPPAVVVNGSALRRSASHRLSSLVVGPPGSGADREPSVHGRAFNRSSSRFLEGAVAGPAISVPQRGSSTGYVTSPAFSTQPSGKPPDDGGGSGEGPEIGLVLSAPSPHPPMSPEARLAHQPSPTGEEPEGNGLLDPELLALANAQEGQVGGDLPRAPSSDLVSPSSQAGGGDTAPAAGAARHPSKISSAASGGGDAMIEAALLRSKTGAGPDVGAAAGPEGREPSQRRSDPRGAATAPPGGGGAAAAGLRTSAPSSPLPRLAGVVARPSPLSRCAVGGTSGGASGTPSAGPTSRLHTSSSAPKLENLADSEQLLKQQQPDSTAKAAAGGAESESERLSRRGSAAAEADRGLLQSVLVIKPNTGRGPALPSNSMGHGVGVRLVQRLGDDNGRGGLEALRTDTLAASSRGLGRGSVKLPHAPQLELAEPPAAEPEAASAISPSAAWIGTERPLGRSSLSAPNAGRPGPGAGGASGALPEDGNVRPSGSETVAKHSPFEFAMPEDMAGGPSIINPFQAGVRPGADGGGGGEGGGEGGALGRASVRQYGGPDGTLGRSSIRAGGAADAGGLGRSSVRGAPTGGGGLGRASVRLGRQAGLAAVSTQLARIYDADGGTADGQGQGKLPGRPSFSLEPPAARLAATQDAIQQQTSSGLPSPALSNMQQRGSNSHIAVQMPSIQHRESAQQLATASVQGAAQQYSLGATSKGVLMSLIRRSASQARSYSGANAQAGSSGGGAGSMQRDQLARGSAFESLARRTRFADNTAMALARASASGALCQQSSENVDGAGNIGSPALMCDPLLVEYRLRLLTGLKQYYKQKHAAGSLSPSAYKVLSYITDQSAHHPEHELSLWTMAKKEISSGLLMEMEIAVYFRLKLWTSQAKASSVALVRKVVPRLISPFVRLISSHTSAATLRGLETAVELWASLTQSLQTEWLQYSGVYGERLLEEVQHEADGAWAYIIERRIEAPKKFGAVQTHRAVIDVLTQQQAFVREMNEGGMIEESEYRKIVEMVEKRLQLLARRGPRWRQPTVMEVLQGTAVLRGVSPKVVEWVRKNSTFKMYPQGAAIWDMGRKQAGAEPDGLIIVIRGVVRMMLEQDGALVPYYLGAGGVGGLVSCVLESHVPGMSSAAAYAEGNALGKGPVVMHIPWPVLQVLKRFSREECVLPYQALELQLYRTAAVYVLDLLRQQVTHQFSSFIRSSLLTILSSRRLDTPAMRRQRIRLLLQPAAADNFVDGGIDWIGELLSADLEVARQLLDPRTGNPSVGHHHYHHHNHSHGHHHLHGSVGHMNPYLESHRSGGSAGGAEPAGAQQPLQRIAATPWVEVMYKAIAAATTSVMDIIRTSLKDSVLVVLGPRQGIIQRTTMVLIQGTLEPAPIADADGTGGAAGVGGPFVATSNEMHVAPSVMVWVSDYFEGELVAQKELRVVAGPRGATLLLWGVAPEDLLLPSPSAEPVGGTPVGSGSAAAATAGEPQKPSGGKAEHEPARGIIHAAKSMAMRALQDGGKIKPEAVAMAAAVAAANGAASPKQGPAAAAAANGGGAANGSGTPGGASSGEAAKPPKAGNRNGVETGGPKPPLPPTESEDSTGKGKQGGDPPQSEGGTSGKAV